MDGWVSSGVTAGFRVLERFQTTLIGKPACIPIDLTGIGNSTTLLECSLSNGRRRSESGAMYFRVRLTGDREERWAVYEMWIRGRDDD
jgi:hypothetical protein